MESPSHRIPVDTISLVDDNPVETAATPTKEVESEGGDCSSQHTLPVAVGEPSFVSYQNRPRPMQATAMPTAEPTAEPTA